MSILARAVGAQIASLAIVRVAKLGEARHGGVWTFESLRISPRKALACVKISVTHILKVPYCTNSASKKLNRESLYKGQLCPNCSLYNYWDHYVCFCTASWMPDIKSAVYLATGSTAHGNQYTVRKSQAYSYESHNYLGQCILCCMV